MACIMPFQQMSKSLRSLRLVLPPILTFVLAFGVKGLVYNCLFSADIREMVFAGTVVGYVWYEVCHYYIHHSKTHFAFTQSLKEYHMHHHYRTPLLGFGVSSKLWDTLFDTEILAFKHKTRPKAIE